MGADGPRENADIQRQAGKIIASLGCELSVDLAPGFDRPDAPQPLPLVQIGKPVQRLTLPVTARFEAATIFLHGLMKRQLRRGLVGAGGGGGRPASNGVIEVTFDLLVPGFMERGTLCPMRNGRYFNRQTWERGRNVVRYVPAAHVPALRRSIAGYRRFLKLAEQYAALIVQQTRRRRSRRTTASGRRPWQRPVTSAARAVAVYRFCRHPLPISSSVRPFVSGTKRMTITRTRQKKA
jgi:hypothetical protein